MGVSLFERGFGASDQFGVVVVDIADVAQGPSHAHYGYDLGRPVEVELACESLFQVDAFANDGCSGEDARAEEWFVGEANKPRAHSVAEHGGYAWWWFG